MLLNKQNVHLTQPTPALTPVYLTSRQGVDTEDGSLASDHDYHIVICSVTRGLVQRPGRPCTPCVMLPTNPAPYTIVEWGIQTARYNVDIDRTERKWLWVGSTVRRRCWRDVA